jgi:hypothetical protein
VTAKRAVRVERDAGPRLIAPPVDDVLVGRGEEVVPLPLVVVPEGAAVTEAETEAEPDGR